MHSSAASHLEAGAAAHAGGLDARIAVHLILQDGLCYALCLLCSPFISAMHCASSAAHPSLECTVYIAAGEPAADQQQGTTDPASPIQEQTRAGVQQRTESQQLAQAVGRIQLNKALSHEDYSSMPVGEALQKTCDWDFQLLLAKRRMLAQEQLDRMEVQGSGGLSLRQLLHSTGTSVK